jgi:hypothetical protein
MSAINHGTEVPAKSRREVLMGYQYALDQHKKKLREEKDEITRSQENNSVSSGAYWDEYSEASILAERDIESQSTIGGQQHEQGKRTVQEA